MEKILGDLLPRGRNPRKGMEKVIEYLLLVPLYICLLYYDMYIGIRYYYDMYYLNKVPCFIMYILLEFCFVWEGSWGFWFVLQRSPEFSFLSGLLVPHILRIWIYDNYLLGIVLFLRFGIYLLLLFRI